MALTVQRIRFGRCLQLSDIGLQGTGVCDTISAIMEETMEEDRTLYLCTCKDKNCTGRTVIECSPQVPSDAGLAHEVSECPPCPVCGREMKMVPMVSEGIEFFPEPARPDALSQTIR